MDQSEVKNFVVPDVMPATLDEPSKLLWKAAKLIQEKGHAKNQLAAALS